MAQLSLENITSTSFDIVVSEMYVGTPKTVTVTVNGEDWWIDYVISDDDDSVTFLTGDLDSGTYYEVEVSIYYSQLWETQSLSGSCTTAGGSGGSDDAPDLSSAKVVVTEFDQTSISVQLVGLDENYNGDWMVIFYIYTSRTNLNNEEHLFLSLVSADGGVPETSVVIFSDLEPNTKYWIDARIYYNDDTESEWSDYITQTTDGNDIVVRPGEFQWATVKTKGQPFKLTATEWCDLLDNINSVREYLGLTPVGTTDNTDALAYFYYPSKGDSILASMYNQIIYCYDDMGLLRYIDNFVSPKDPITADKLNLLMNTINDVE